MKVIRLVLIVMLPFLMTLGASAAVVTFDYDFELSGATAPAGVAPWLRATFDDAANPGSVRLTMSTFGLTDREFTSEWLFNLDPTLNPVSLTFTTVDNTASIPNSISTGVNAFKADGDGFFDIQFVFPPPPGNFASEFTAGETVIYDIGGIMGLTANSFSFGSAPGGGAGTYLAAAHVQGIGTGAQYSGWVAPEDGGGGQDGKVPEPATLFLLGSGLAGLAGYARKRMKKQ